MGRICLFLHRLAWLPTKAKLSLGLAQAKQHIAELNKTLFQERQKYSDEIKSSQKKTQEKLKVNSKSIPSKNTIL